jgi:hypothetical protein
MTGIRSFAVSIAIVVSLAAAGAANATPATAVTLSVPTTFANTSDPFTSTGGVVCATGTVSTPFAIFVGGQSDTHAQILVGKHFVCPSGSFDVLLRVTLDFADGGTGGTWSVVAGSGAYAKLHGAGTIEGTPFDGGIQDEYAGSMHLD